MGYQVIFAPRAIQRLAETVRFIARENPDAALRFGNRLIGQAQLLAEFPELGTSYPKRLGVRRLWCKPYFIYYRLQTQTQVVEIMDYWHSARREPL